MTHQNFQARAHQAEAGEIFSETEEVAEDQASADDGRLQPQLLAVGGQSARARERPQTKVCESLNFLRLFYYLQYFFSHKT